MRGKEQLLLLITGLLLYIFDLGSDIYVAIQYYRTDQRWWFSLTITFIIVPVVVVNVAAGVQVFQTKNSASESGNGNAPQASRGNLRRRLSFPSLLFFFRRYREEFMRWKYENCDHSPCESNCERSNYEPHCGQCDRYLKQKKESAKSAYMFAWLHHIGTVTESAPQWCLQVYITLRQWHFPWYSLLSNIFSLLSLAWSITALERARHKKNANFNFKRISIFVFLIWQLSSLVSRLFAVVFCAYILKYYVFGFVILHWVLAMLFYDLWFSDGFKCSALLWFLLSNCPLFFNVSEPLLRSGVSKTREPKWEPKTIKVAILKINISLAVQNILMLVIPVAFSKSDVPHIDTIKSIAVPCVTGGLVVGAVFSIAFFKLYYPTRIAPANTGDTEPRNDQAETGCGTTSRPGSVETIHC